MLFLHIRSLSMNNCALILLSSFPVAWLVASCVLAFLLLVLVVLLVLKSREATLLKNEVMELRDTMRMMRYEEASLARMLHTVNKPQESFAPSSSACEEDVQAADEQDSPLDTSVAESAEEQHAQAEEVAESEALAQVPALELPEPPLYDTAREEMPIVAAASLEMPNPAHECSALPDVEAMPTVSSPLHKQAINERRPAIPTDLFAAWFAEHDSLAPQDTLGVGTESPETIAVQTDEVTPLLQANMADAVVHDEAGEMSDDVADVQESVVVPAGDDYPALSKEDERFCRKLERIVNTRLRNPNLNIDIIAAQLGLGRTNFYRKVRELLGMSPNDYLRKCRMERAAELLCDSELPINDICAQVGIPDAQYFSRVFKTHFGVSPSVYREKQSISH